MPVKLLEAGLVWCFDWQLSITYTWLWAGRCQLSRPDIFVTIHAGSIHTAPCEKYTSGVNYTLVLADCHNFCFWRSCPVTHTCSRWSPGLNHFSMGSIFFDNFDDPTQSAAHYILFRKTPSLLRPSKESLQMKKVLVHMVSWLLLRMALNSSCLVSTW